MPTPAQLRIRASTAARLDKSGPITAAMGQDLVHLETVAERLDTLRSPTLLALGRLRACAGHISLRSDLFRVHLRSKLSGSREAIEHAQVAILRARPPADRAEEEQMRGSVARQIQAETAAALAASLAEGDPQAMAFSTKTIEGLKALEDCVARERLASLGIGGHTKDLSLEDLLRQQATLADLELRPAAELGGYFEALVRVSPDEARRIEGLLLLVAKKRADIVPARQRAREAARPNDVEADRLAALSLVHEIERQRELRTSPELAIFDAEIRSPLGALVRRILGIDVRDLSPADFENYSRTWRASTRLDEVALRTAWPLRVALADLPDSVRRQLPGKFFGPASKEG